MTRSVTTDPIRGMGRFVSPNVKAWADASFGSGMAGLILLSGVVVFAAVLFIGARRSSTCKFEDGGETCEATSHIDGKVSHDRPYPHEPQLRAPRRLSSFWRIVNAARRLVNAVDTPSASV